MSHSTKQSVLFDGIFAKPVHVSFDGESQSSDGGALLVASLDRKAGLSEALARCIGDSRQQAKVRYDLETL